MKIATFAGKKWITLLAGYMYVLFPTISSQEVTKKHYIVYIYIFRIDCLQVI